jgi:hypothetical protein
MRGKNMSFGDVIRQQSKRGQFGMLKSRARLSDLLRRWEEDSSEDFTLYLGTASTLRSRSNQMNICGQSKEGIFDSWIEQQVTANKENSDTFGNFSNRSNKEEQGAKKLALSSRTHTTKYQRIIHEPSKHERKRFGKNLILPPTEIELIASK